jgi:hypothetical protein
MFGYITIDESLIESAVNNLEEFHQQKYGTQAESIVHAIAMETLAQRVRERVVAHQVAKSGLATL